MARPRPTTYPGVTLRRMQERDLEFLFGVYASTRAVVMPPPTDRNTSQDGASLRVQFDARHAYYRANYPHARFDVIVRDGEDVGRLYVDRRTDEIRIMDIALLPRHRNRGIGSALLRALLDEATQLGKLVSLHVAEANPAKRLYQRMGFVVAGEVSPYQLLHWIPATVTPVPRRDASAPHPDTPPSLAEPGQHVDAVPHARPDTVAAGWTVEWRLREEP
jgi:ribosomal protein S18 acetylase RimI-like enzyme